MDKFKQILFLATIAVTATVAQSAELAVTPNATARTQALLNWLANTQGSHILSGQMEGSLSEGSETPFNRIFNITGKYPALRGFDFANYSPDRASSDDGSTQRAINWFNANGIVEFQWHWYMRGSDGTVEVYANQPSGSQIKPTDFDISRAVTSGTSENTRFLAGIDAIATQLKALKSANIPVLWRPFHECSSGSFWWGTKGSDSLKAAWKIMFDRLVNTHKLTNLIWIFNPASSADLAAWYPGDEYVDIISYDGYGDKGAHPTFASEYKSIKTLAGAGKLVTLTENGGIPDTSVLVSQGAYWLSYMTWHDEWSNNPDWNSDEFLVKTYNSSYVYSRDELPNLKSLSAPTAGATRNITISRQPTNSYPGEPWQIPVYAAAVDSTGKIVRTQTGTVTFKLGQLSQKAPLINGVAKFNPTFSSAATGQTITASFSSFFSATSASFNIGSAIDNSKFNFESSSSNWQSTQPLALSSLHAYAGTKSLQIPLNNSSGQVSASVNFESSGTAPPGAGSKITIKVWIPEGTNLSGLYAFAQENSSKNWRFTTGSWLDKTSINTGTWNTISVALPTDATDLYSLGLTLTPQDGKNLTGSIYIDSINW